jgi:hypothetical protein
VDAQLPAEEIREPTIFSATTYAESKPFIDAPTATPTATPTAAPTDRNVPQAERIEEELRAHVEKIHLGVAANVGCVW